MKLIIDISEEDRKDIGNIHFVREDLRFKIGKAIMCGTPLDDVKLKIEQDMSWDMFNDYGNETAIHKELWEIFDNIGKGDSE